MLALLALLWPTQAAPARHDGGVYALPNADPRTLTEAQVDPLMWPIVQRINQSGWVWTTESCQGHETGWTSVILGVVTDDPGRFFGLLAEAHRAMVPPHPYEHDDPQGLRVHVEFWTVPRVTLGRYQVRLLFPAGVRRDLARQVLQMAADRTWRRQ